MIKGYAELEFDLPAALLNSLLETLRGVEEAPLIAENATGLPEEQGVYQLLHHGVPVYVGKTDAKHGLMDRLFRHSRKLLHRAGLDPEAVTFKAVRVYVFTAIDVEGDLIQHLGSGDGLAWNGSGFGSNDPGRERDTTKNKETNFDALYPIDIDRTIEVDFEAGSAGHVIRTLRTMLPYTLRAQKPGRSARLHADLEDTMIGGISGATTVRELIAKVISQLPLGWQATKLLGYVVIYKEDRAYPDSEIIARS